MLAEGANPPLTKNAVCVPEEPISLVAVPKLVVVVQEDPLYSSVAFVDVDGEGPGAPPATIAAVCGPPPLLFTLLAVFKLFPSDQLDPLYSSELSTPLGLPPPKAKAAEVIPVAPILDLAVLRLGIPVQLDPS